VNAVELWQLKQMQSLPLEAKIIKSQQRIREWYEHWDGNVYVSFSGGKDSTVLLHLVRQLYPDVPAVFCDTGLEFPEIKEFVRQTENVTILRPDMSFKKVIEKYGYPTIGKEVAECVEGARKGQPYRIRRFDPNYKPMFNVSKWAFLLDAPFKISASCCDVMKKSPFRRYEKETGFKPILGTMAAESRLRTQGWLKAGCNAFENKRPVSQPLSFWLEQDIWGYLHKFDVPYSTIYDMGYQRTGCIFCMFGCHLEPYPNRFQKLSQTHPKLYEYCMKPASEGGLGLAAVLDYIGVDYECRGKQLTFEWEEDAGQTLPIVSRL
jgi:3'-phosphoadenosine 5'-phosphosulfate sulfotransferase (PAPS reductase)/FAD synthetase